MASGVRGAKARLNPSRAAFALLIVLLACQPIAAAERRVLVLTDTAGFRHDSIADAQALIRHLARRSPRYQVRILEHASELTAARLRHAAAVVFLNTSGELAMTSEQRAALLQFVRDGGGFVGTHSASDTFHAWPQYVALLGGEFERHPFVGTGVVVVEDASHPATRRLGPSFTIMEEFYFFRQNPRASAHVLARLDVSSFGGDGHEDRPLVWCRREGKGRVFYDALGHFSETWRDDRQRALLAGGIAWVVRAGAHRAATEGCSEVASPGPSSR
jgi:type 1 glutamine amidotransferase